MIRGHGKVDMEPGTERSYRQLRYSLNVPSREWLGAVVGVLLMERFMNESLAAINYAKSMS